MPMLRSSTSIALLIGWIFLVLPSNTVLADTWDIKAGLGPVYGSTFSSQEDDGVGLAGYFDLGLSESFSLTLGGTYVDHLIGSKYEYSMFNVGLGVTYNIDVFVVVPFLSLRLGWLQRDFESLEDDNGFGLSLGIGFDYLWSENLTFGFVAEYHGMLTDLDRFPAYAAFIGRVGLRWPR
jgi:hypothetical protein